MQLQARADELVQLRAELNQLRARITLAAIGAAGGDGPEVPPVRLLPEVERALCELAATDASLVVCDESVAQAAGEHSKACAAALDTLRSGEQVHGQWWHGNGWDIRVGWWAGDGDGDGARG